uniref:procollagen-proline 4-dioxygenase n=1 Tax=Anopheles atroparvus TaxID=41427 RepID=A0A182ITR6_ANOAO
MASSVPWKLLPLAAAVILCCLHPWANVRGEYFSSVEKMRQLVKLEESLIASLEHYIKLHEQKVAFLHRQKDLLTKELKEAQKNEVQYVSNPITAFMIANRLVTDWERIRSFMAMDVGAKLENSTTLPTTDDVLGIVEGLARLQDIYQLDAKEVASGKVLDRQLHRQLTPADCYQIGVKLSGSYNYRLAISWLREALRRWTTENPGVSKVEIMNALSYALSQQGEYEEALELTNNVLKMQPDNERARLSKDPLEKWIDYKKEHGLPPRKPEPDYGNYYSLCRGDFHRPASDLATLHCRYERSRSPFLRIAPLKVEEVNHDPYIVVYHQVISDKEIDTLHTISKSSMKRAMVGDDNKKEVSKSRTSSNGWLEDFMHPVVRAVTTRTEDMSGLTMDAAEQLQVGNYGIGGHYLPHHDYVVPEEGKEPYPVIGKGNRIATVMYYLSDVEIGGATVFPEIGVGIFPRKGSAIFWYNLHANGTADSRTLHAACPVFLGSKWVANKWIHEHGQEFRRPCQLDQKA